MSLRSILASQDRWARERWPRHLGRRAPSLEDNLFLRMAPAGLAQFTKGSGGELGRNGKPGKMSSLRSSSALAYNFFGPWLGRDLGPLQHALNVSLVDSAIEFERQFQHGLSTIPPNIDVVLDCRQPRPLGIESKFTEPYGPKPVHRPLDNKYFAGNRARWAELGLPMCQELARSIGTGVTFARLGAGQLLKHILGLAWVTQRSPRLFCLWFDNASSEANEHRIEIDRFHGLIDPQVEFKVASYQQVFRRLQKEPEPVPGYYEYLAARYFAA